MTAIIIPIESERSSFSEVLTNVGFLTWKVFLKNHRVTFHKKITNNFETNLLKKYKNKKKFLGGGGQIYHIWTWPNLFILGLSFSIFAHKKTTGKPVASKFKLNYSLTTLAACALAQVGS